MVRKDKFKAIDLFCGCGGLTLGLKQAGFNVLGAVEVDPLAAETFRMNHRKVHLWETDIQKLKPGEILKALALSKGQLDLLAGCPPCQGFSSMRTFNGGRIVEDKRNDLIYDFLRLVKGLKPKSVMMENVPGLADDKRFTDFIDKMKIMGYKGDYRILNTADYGVPQRRRRLIYMARRGQSISFCDPITKKTTVRESISLLPNPGNSGDPVHDMPEKRTPQVMERIKNIPKNGGSRTALPNSLILKCHKKSRGFKDVYGRMSWDDVSPTITSGCVNPSKGRFIHPDQDRTITLREAALLQSFPIDYRFSLKGGKQGVATMIGNALPPKFIMKQSKQIALHLQSDD